MELAHRLVSTRRGTILMALFAALIAGVLILVYVSRYRESVQSENARVTVLVARQAIPKGTSGSVIASKGLYTVKTLPQGQLIDGAFSDPSSLVDKVTTHAILPEGQLAASDFAVGAGRAVSSLTGRERVIAVPLDAAHGLIGEIEAGDHVDVYAGFNVIPLGPGGAPVAGAQARPVVRRILTDIPVVSVGSSRGGFGGAGGSTVELKVSDAQAAQIAFSSENGKVWLAQRPGAGATSSKPQLVTLETLLLGVPPVTVLRSFKGQ
jgi:Flp pilus assembly protein CpaB